MRATRFGNDNSLAQKALSALVTNDQVLARLAEQWPQEGMFTEPNLEFVVRRLIDYQRQYGRAPGLDINRLFEDDWQRRKDEGSIKLIEQYLCWASQEEDETLETDVALELVQDWINKRRLREAQSESDYKLEMGDVTGAVTIVQSFEPLLLTRSKFRCAADDDVQPLRWMWPGWLAYGQMTLLDGMPGSGKSTLMADIAARVTRGWAMPPAPLGTPGGRRPRGVLIMCHEEPWEQKALPRLRRYGADEERIFRLDPEELLTIPSGLPQIERIITKNDIRLLTFDPISAFLDERTEANVEQSVRRVLHSLGRVVNRCGCCSLSSRHLAKSGRRDPMTMGLGSIGWTGAHRLVALLTGRGNSPRLLACTKTNLGPTPKSFSFEIEQEEIPTRNKDGKKFRAEIGVIGQWAESDITAEEAVFQGPGRRPDKSEEAREAIIRLLTEREEMSRAELKELVMKECECCDRTYQKAARDCKLEERRNGFGGKRSVRLP